MQHFALGLAELREVYMGSPLHPGQVPSLHCVVYTTKLGAVSKPAVRAPSPTVCTAKDVV